MLCRSWFPGGRRLAPRRSATTALVLALILLACGLLMRGSAQAPDGERKAVVKDPDADAGIPSLEQMRRHIPPGVPAEQRQQMLRMMKRYREQMRRARELGGGPFGGAIPPGNFPPFPRAGQGQFSRLGVEVGKPSATLVAQLDLPRGQGLVLEEITANSAAAKAGLKPHDILLELDGKAVTSDSQEFARALDRVKDGVPVNVIVLRRGKNETIKGLKLPKAEATPALGPGRFQPPFPQMPPVPPPIPVMPIPAPDFAGMPPGAPFGNGVLTTTFRSQDRFVTRHQEGSLVITVVGKAGDGKAAVQQIRIQDARDSGQYDAVDKVPEMYRDKVKGLVETVEKRNARIDVKAR